MKVKFVCNSGANIHSAREEIIDLEDWGISAQDWQDMTEEQKQEVVQDWAYDRLEIYYTENLEERTWL